MKGNTHALKGRTAQVAGHLQGEGQQREVDRAGAHARIRSTDRHRCCPRGDRELKDKAFS